MRTSEVDDLKKRDVARKDIRVTEQNAPGRNAAGEGVWGFCEGEL